MLSWEAVGRANAPKERSINAIIFTSPDSFLYVALIPSPICNVKRVAAEVGVEMVGLPLLLAIDA